MRSAAFAAVAGALGAAAFEKFAVFDDFNRLDRSDCGHLNGCGRVDRGGFVPDQKTFFFPEKNFEQGRFWDLIARDGRYGDRYKDDRFFDDRYRHHDNYGHRYHDDRYHHNDKFRDVFRDNFREEEFFSRVRFDFEEEFLVFDFDDCNDRFERFEFRERAIFEEIEVFIAVEEPNFDHGHRFSLHDGHCRYDDDRHYRCRVPFNDLVHGGFREMCPVRERGGQFLFIKIRTVIKIEEERFEIINRGHDNRDYFALSYACSECKSEYYEKDCFRDRECHRPEKDCHRNYHHPHYPRDVETLEARSVQDFSNRYEGGRKQHDGHRYGDIDYECEGTFLKAYGTGERCHPFNELSEYSHPNSCGLDNGFFHRYPKNELEVSVNGPIELDGYKFGHFTVILEKQRDDAFIFVEIKIDDVDYFVTEVAAFIECDGGIDDLSLATTSHPNICKPESYPHRHYDDRGLDSFRFEILDEFKCRGDYFIAVYVLVCVAEDKCEYRKGHYKPYGGYGYGY